MSECKAIILLPRIQVQSANAVSGPLTWGFPSPTAFTGFVHALQRRMESSLKKGFGGVGIICHKFDPQVSRPAGKFTQVFHLTRNPLGKDGNSAAIVEEGRAHLEVSLLLTLHDSVDDDEKDEFANRLMQTAHTLRLAGGSILPQREGKRYQAQFIAMSQGLEEQEKTFRKLRLRLLPGFALVQREDRLKVHLDEMRENQPQTNALDALLDLTRLNFEPPNLDDPERHSWSIRKHEGWLVPLPVGYSAISPLFEAGEVRNARDNESPFRFVENLYSLGEWVSPHRATTLQQLLWYRETDAEKGVYCCTNHYSNYITQTNVDH